METLYPLGYGHRLGTLAELKGFARFDLLEPGFARRVEAWIVSRGGHVGVGGALRSTQPAKPGFAPAGKTFHMLVIFNDGQQRFMAFDLVTRNGDNVHRAPRWDEVPRQGSGHPDISDYGVHCNVNGEPWHMQAIEVDGFDSWVNRGRLHPSKTFPIKSSAAPTPEPQPDKPSYAPGDRTLSVTSPPMDGMDVAFVQVVCRDKAGQDVTPDGYYGEQTAAAVRNVQAWCQLTADGVVGPQTWALLIEMSKPAPPPPPPPAEKSYAPGERNLMLTTPPMQGMDVAFVQNVCRLNAGQDVASDGYYGEQTVAAVRNVQAWFKRTVDGVVGPKTWALLIDLSKT